MTRTTNAFCVISGERTDKKPVIIVYDPTKPAGEQGKRALLSHFTGPNGEMQDKDTCYERLKKLLGD